MLRTNGQKCAALWRRQKFSFGDYILGGGCLCGVIDDDDNPGELPFPSGVQAQTLFTHFWLQERSKFKKISHNSPPDSWPICFTVGRGLSDTLGT